METTLYINTVNAGRVIVQLITDGKTDHLESDQKFGSQALLGLITQIVDKNKIKLADLTQIKVNVGPGSYTGIKVGVAVANALGFALKIPVNNKQIETKLIYT